MNNKSDINHAIFVDKQPEENGWKHTAIINPFNHVIFVYSSGGSIKCVNTEEARSGVGKQLEENGWKHTATINPSRWIEALFHSDTMQASDMMDELNFGP